MLSEHGLLIHCLGLKIFQPFYCNPHPRTASVFVPHISQNIIKVALETNSWPHSPWQVPWCICNLISSWISSLSHNVPPFHTSVLCMHVSLPYLLYRKYCRWLFYLLYRKYCHQQQGILEFWVQILTVLLNVYATLDKSLKAQTLNFLV